MRSYKVYGDWQNTREVWSMNDKFLISSLHSQQVCVFVTKHEVPNIFFFLSTLQNTALAVYDNDPHTKHEQK